MADRCVQTNKCCFKGRGKLKLQLWDACGGLGVEGVDPFPIVDFGNASDFSVDASVSETTVKDYQSAAGGTFCSSSEIDSVTLKAKGLCLGAANIARQYAGSLTNKVAGTNVSFIGKIRDKTVDTFVPFRDANRQLITKADPASVNLLAPAGLVLGTDYTVSGNGITFLANAPNLVSVALPVAGISVTGDVDHGAYSLIQLLTQTSQDYTLYFDGVNALDGTPFSFVMYRVKVKATGGIPLISDDIASFQFEGTALQDPNITGQSASKYGTLAI